MSFNSSPAYLHFLHQGLVEVSVALVDGLGDGTVAREEVIRAQFFGFLRREFETNTYGFRSMMLTGFAVFLCVSCSWTKLKGNRH